MHSAVRSTPLPVPQHHQLQGLQHLLGLQAPELPEAEQTQMLCMWGSSAASPATTCRASTPSLHSLGAPTHTKAGNTTTLTAML